jgi:hypothetical protein
MMPHIIRNFKPPQDSSLSEFSRKMRRMKNEYDLQNAEGFKINPHVWLEGLLAIAGDKEKKQEVIETISIQSGLPIETVEVIFGSTLKILMNDTRSN